MAEIIKLPPADCYNHPYKGNSIKKLGMHARLKQNKTKWSELRKKLLISQDFKCAYCKIDLHDKRMNVEHVIPVSKGGTNSKDNLVASCSECNRLKGSRLLAKREVRKMRGNLKKFKAQKRTKGRIYKASVTLDDEHNSWFKEMFRED